MRRKLSAFMAIVLCLALLLGTFAFASGEAPAESAAPSESPAAEETPAHEGAEEVIYGRLDNRGRARSAYAVVALTADEAGELVHHGAYTEVENLTDTSPIEYGNGTVRLDVSEPGRYYYQGTLRKAVMPWDIRITYSLDGEEVDPDDLAGQSGELEVDIKTSVNSGFDQYFADNYMLQISVTLDSSLCEDIETRNGTVASAGSDKTITFVVLPGGEGDVGFSANVKDFSMGGFTIAGVPYSMDSMMGGMGELDTVTSGIKQLSGAISQLTGAAGQINSGAGELADNSSTLTEASDQIESALVQIADGLQDFDLSEMTGGLDQLAELPAYLTQIAAGISEAADGLRSLAGGYNEVTERLDTLLSSLMATFDVQNVIKLASTVEELTKTVEALKAENEELKDQHGQTDTPPATSETPEVTDTPVTETDPVTTPAETPPVETEGSSATGNEGGAQMPTDPTAGIQAIIGTYTMLTGKLEEAAAGLDLAVDGLMQMAIQISSGLEGMTDMDTSGITELQSGMAELADNYGQFNEGLKAYTEGVGALSEGMDSYTSGMYTLNNETQAIPDMIDEFLGTGEDEDGEGEEESGLVSFLSDDNSDTAAVQFVLSTEGIAAPEADEPEPPAEADKGFFAELWDKIVSLFT